ncbi:MocR-like pyridoxine biosynthesis transcription factor PdxR [Pollutimonas thiosulfatoxidans]|uniref:DNA-binding protein n=1 Tax=Pollutimonas thiosulfatoxidans TaxID=2028345 RepID=A0A410GFM2_9BURK|nr:PLP-dependent aminotransferase family protein [Pollutimonas thiosulfatoxidans]MBF6615223.1 PLP-dependent aminotransferase family protein [Candidimonas sp.]QAA95107.1 DNA-binding protein [Pollutimonas thiosulfatoxidans]
MDIHLTVHAGSDLTGQIYRQIRSGILEGRLASRERLPSSRLLAAQLGVSRKTTLDVYERLMAEGFLYARSGSGTFVADAMTGLPSRKTKPVATRAMPSPVWRSLPEPIVMRRPGPALAMDFAGGVTDKSRFPAASWRRSLLHALRQQLRDGSGYREPGGDPSLRLAISRYLGFSRALVCSWQEVIVTQGAQQALDLLARVMIQPGDVVAVEDPCYPPARASFIAQGARVVPVPVDEQGLIVERLPGKARLVYVTPSHQFPLGMPMGVERRLQLLEWAKRRDAVIIEDDYDGEFRFEGRPLEPLKSLDPAGLVAYVGTFSKTIFPELRMGYMLAPASLAPALLKAKQIVDWHGCTLTQAALAHFMLGGEFARHLRRMHKLYTARRQTLLKHLQGPLAAWFQPPKQAAGIHMGARFSRPVAEDALRMAAEQASIGLHGLSQFYIERPAEPGLLFGYGNIEVHEIEKALDILAGILPQSLR